MTRARPYDKRAAYYKPNPHDVLTSEQEQANAALVRQHETIAQGKESPHVTSQ